MLIKILIPLISNFDASDRQLHWPFSKHDHKQITQHFSKYQSHENKSSYLVHQ